MFNILLDLIAVFLIDLVKLVYTNLFGNTNTIVNGILDTLGNPGSFPKVPSLFSNMVTLMNIIGWVMLVIVAYGAIAKAVISPYQDTKTPHPLKIALKIMIATVLLAFRMQVIQVAKGIFDVIFGIINTEGAFDISGWNFMGMDIIPSNLFARIVMLCILCYSLITAALAYLERIVTFAIFAYTYPIAIAFSAGDQTNESAKLWLKGMISQIIMITLSTIAIVAGVKLSNNFFSESEIGSMDIVSVFLGMNFLAIAKNSEKFLNMYNIRTMPNQDTLRAFAGGFGLALSSASTGMRFMGKGFDTVKDISAAKGRADSVMAKAAGVNVPGSIGSLSSRYSAAGSEGISGKTESLSKMAGRAYADSIKGKTVGTSTLAERMSQQKLDIPSDKELKIAGKQSGAVPDSAQAGTRTIGGTAYNQLQKSPRQADFNAGVKENIASRNEAIDRVNAGIAFHTGTPMKDTNTQTLDERFDSVFKANHAKGGQYQAANTSFLDKNDFSEGAKDSYLRNNDSGYWTWKGEVPDSAPKVSNKDVADAYGLSQTLPNFTPSSGQAAWVRGSEDSMHNGFLISGTEYNPRNGETEAKSYVIGDEYTQLEANGRMGTGTGGNYDAVDVSDRNMHQVSDQLFAYEAKPHSYSEKEFPKGNTEAFENAVGQQAELFESQKAFGYGSTSAPYMDLTSFEIPEMTLQDMNGAGGIQGSPISMEQLREPGDARSDVEGANKKLDDVRTPEEKMGESDDQDIPEDSCTIPESEELPEKPEEDLS